MFGTLTVSAVIPKRTFSTLNDLNLFLRNSINLKRLVGLGVHKVLEIIRLTVNTEKVIRSIYLAFKLNSNR